MRRVLSATAASALFTDADAPTPLANLYHEPVAVLAMVRTVDARSDGALAHRPPRTANTTRHTEERCARSSFRAPHGRVAAVRTRRSARAAVLERDHWKFKDRDETKNRSFVMSHGKIEPMIWERF